MIVALALAEEPAATLEQAYQKEFAYLRAERSELQERLAEVDGDAARRIARADAELAALQTKLVAATRAADRAEDGFDQLERETAAMDDADVLLTTTLEQAADALGLPKPSDPPTVFAAAAGRIAAAGEVGWREGVFFLTDGQQVEGRVYAWGQVAAWGASDRGSGALAPVGEGHLQLRRDFGRATAAALLAGDPPAMLEVQLYEPERAVEEAEKAGGLGQLLKDAGTMGQVLFGLGCVSAALVAIRGTVLLFARRGGMALVEAVTAHVRADRMGEAHALLGRRRNPTARVIGAVLDAADRAPDEQDRVVDEAILRETPRIDLFAAALVVITAGAPLMGLLGTVTGMIATFDVITEHGTGNPKLMSAGIAEALVCTALGLAVAIPTLLAGNVLASLAETVKISLDRGALATLNALHLRVRSFDREAAK
ncbi:MAG: MotA/TolQ/ExbB proton channel family protein [Myxococcota bacterium]